ncbi:MAG: hypothetical protein ACJATA_001296 [Sphingobacteriales bacterium]|jgi:hypothetical protein
MLVNSQLRDHNSGNFFPPAMNFTGKVTLVGSVFFWFISPLVGICLLIAGVFLAFTRKGLFVRLDEKQVKPYVFIFGVKYGQWMDISHLKRINIAKRNFSTIAYSSANRPAAKAKNTFYDVFLEGESRKDKLLVFRSEEMLESQNKFLELQSAWELEKV